MKLERFFSLGNSMDLSTRTAILAAIKAGKRIRDNYHHLHQMENSRQIKREKLEQSWIKEEGDPRTITSRADTESDRIIRETFLSAGNFVVFTEESGISTPEHIDSSSWKRVVVDPLDGSKNFLVGLWGLFGISIGVEEKNSALCSVLYNPCSEELIYAERGKGACLLENLSFENHREWKTPVPISIHTQARLGESRIYVGHGKANPSVLARAPLVSVITKTVEAVNYGSCIIGLMSVALNRLDGLISPSLRYWDIAAARCIIREAGGYAEIWSSDWKYQLTDAECAQADEKSLLSLVVAGNKSLFKEMVQLITTT